MSDRSNYRHPRATRRVLGSLVPVICPPEWERLTNADAVVDEVERMMAAMPLAIRVALVSGIASYDLASVLYPPSRGRRAHRLALDTARAYFRFWAHGTALQKNFVKGVKGLVGLSYYEQPEVLESIGYMPETWIDKVKARRLQVYRDDIVRFEDQAFEAEPIPLPSEVAKRTETTPSLRGAKEAS